MANGYRPTGVAGSRGQIANVGPVDFSPLQAGFAGLGQGLQSGANTLLGQQWKEKEFESGEKWKQEAFDEERFQFDVTNFFKNFPEHKPKTWEEWNQLRDYHKGGGDLSSWKSTNTGSSNILSTPNLVSTNEQPTTYSPVRGAPTPSVDYPDNIGVQGFNAPEESWKDWGSRNLNELYNNPVGEVSGWFGFAGGGYVPGDRIGDLNNARLEDGEYVLNKNATQTLGKGFLDWMNNDFAPRFGQGTLDPNQQQIPGMQSGGYFSGSQGWIPDWITGGVPTKQALGFGGIGNFDMNNPASVKALQRRLGVEDDGMFGPKTEAAYRAAIDEERQLAGKESYRYDYNDALARDRSKGSSRIGSFLRDKYYNLDKRFGGKLPGAYKKDNIMTAEQYGMQQGGAWSSPGYTPGYREQTTAREADEFMGDVERDAANFAIDISNMEREAEADARRLKGWGSGEGWLRYIGDIAPDSWIEGAYSLFGGLGPEYFEDTAGGFSGVPHAKAKKAIADKIRDKEYMKIPDNINLNPQQYSRYHGLQTLPTSPMHGRLTADQLKREYAKALIGEPGIFDANAWIAREFGGGMV